MRKRLLLSLSAVVFSFTAFAQGSNGLVAHWDFNGTTNDVSGNGLSGNPLAITYAPGFTGNTNKAAYFKGYDTVSNNYAYVSVPYNAAMNNTQYSLCVLLKPVKFNSDICQGNRIFQRGLEYSSSYTMLELQDNVYDNDCYTYSPNNFYFVTGIANTAPPSATELYQQPAQTNTWYCVTATFDGDSARLYIDGVLKKSVYRHYQLSASTNGLSIGRNYDYVAGGLYPFPFTGYIDDIRLYNRPLSAQEAGMYCDSAKMIPTAVAEVPEEELLQVYPNPTRGNVTIQLPDDWKHAHCLVQNSIGQEVRTQQVDRISNSVDMNSLPAGIYLLRIISDDKIITRKVLKQ